MLLSVHSAKTRTDTWCAAQNGDMSEAQYEGQSWDDFYRGEAVWSGLPNEVLVREVTELPPGRALDVGSGEGADAVWLARQGWQVTAVDISAVALDRAAAHVRKVAPEVSSRIEWWRADVTTTAPTRETYALVTACYFHLPPHPRANALRGLAAAVAPGGTLLVVGHDPHELARLEGHGPAPDTWFMPEEIAALLDSRVFDLLVATIRPRSGGADHAPGQDGQEQGREQGHGSEHEHLPRHHSADVVVRAQRRT